MKSPVTAMEVRYRTAGDTGWITERFTPSEQVVLPDTSRGEVYEIQARNIGVQGVPPSDWVTVPFVMPDTNRQGAAALPPVSVGNAASRWISGTSVTYSATDTEATISVTAGTLQVGDRQISYGPSSAVVSGTPNTAVRFWLYYDDFNFSGGTRTLGATTDPTASMASNGRILISPIDVTFAPPGGSTGGGGDIGGGGGGSGGGRPGDPQQPQIEPE